MQTKAKQHQADGKGIEQGSDGLSAVKLFARAQCAEAAAVLQVLAIVNSTPVTSKQKTEAAIGDRLGERLFRLCRRPAYLAAA